MLIQENEIQIGIAYLPVECVYSLSISATTVGMAPIIMFTAAINTSVVIKTAAPLVAQRKSSFTIHDNDDDAMFCFTPLFN